MKIRTLVDRILYYIIYLLDFIIPKNNRQFLFASNGRKIFTGNAKKLYLDLKIYDNLIISFTQKELSEDVNYINLRTIKGIIYFLRTKYLIGTHGVADFLYPFSKRKIFVQTWHGSPLKKMGLCEASRSNKTIKEIKKATAKIDYLLSSSEMVTSSLIRCFGIDEDKVLNIGYPRNDNLINYKKNNSLSKKYDNKKIILYAPTFRDWTDVKLFPFSDLDFNHLDKTLSKNNAVILVRSHINDQCSEIKTSDSIIQFGIDKCQDVNEILGEVDLLITDYSSIYFDFLLLDRPTIFLPYDLEEYIDKRGFLYDGYSELMVGDKVFTYKEFVDSLVFNLNNDKYKSKRKIINTLFNSNQSNNTAQKLVNILGVDI